MDRDLAEEREISRLRAREVELHLEKVGIVIILKGRSIYSTGGLGPLCSLQNLQNTPQYL